MSLKQIQAIILPLPAGSIYWLIYQIRISAWFCRSNDPKTEDRYIFNLPQTEWRMHCQQSCTTLVFASAQKLCQLISSQARWSKHKERSKHYEISFWGFAANRLRLLVLVEMFSLKGPVSFEDMATFFQILPHTWDFFTFIHYLYITTSG